MDGQRFLRLETKKTGYLCNNKFFQSSLYSYVNSFYFCATVASTVGYGDFVNYGHNVEEKIFLIFLEFTGILGFSLILANISNLKKDKTIASLMNEKVTFIQFN